MKQLDYTVSSNKHEQKAETNSFFQQRQFIFNYNVRNTRRPICVFCLQRFMHISDISFMLLLAPCVTLCHAALTGLAWLLASLPFSFVKISTCSSQKAGQRPIRFTEISVSTTEILATGIKSFPYEHSSPGVF